MSPAELERAVDGPAEALGVRFEPGLVAQIVADVVDRRGALPLLQYALTELFDRRAGDVITWPRTPRSAACPAPSPAGPRRCRRARARRPGDGPAAVAAARQRRRRRRGRPRPGPAP